MTRRSNPPPRRPPSGPGRPGGKDKNQNIDNELRLSRAIRKAESLQKQRLRRGDWDTESDNLEGEPAEPDLDSALEDGLDETEGREDDEGE